MQFLSLFLYFFVTFANCFTVSILVNNCVLVDSHSLSSINYTQVWISRNYKKKNYFVKKIKKKKFSTKKHFRNRTSKCWMLNELSMLNEGNKNTTIFFLLFCVIFFSKSYKNTCRIYISYVCIHVVVNDSF